MNSGGGSSARHAPLVAVAAAACVACCAGPVLGVLAAIGLGTALGAALWGVGALVVGALLTVFVLRRRRNAARQCEVAAAAPVAVEVGARATRPRR